ncbi:MAG: hypothetical protein PHT07_22915 [Paludibacter sp.]|nr:hypothetical protein [Paludibacter sp.]
MKTNIKIRLLFVILMTSCVFYPGKASAQENNISFQVFYDELSPYGQWIDYSDYGYVWLPDAASDFVPYSTDGHWILTDYGWTWASDFDWGWATFHYGRWSFNDSFGWFWVPDNEWGPAWVNWREADGYYGWSPMEPGVSLSMSFDRGYDRFNDHWMFVRSIDFERDDVHNYYVNRSDNARIARNSSVIRRTFNDRSRNTTYAAGPSREAVQVATGRTIRPFAVRENNRPGQVISNGQIRIYRPQVTRNMTNNRQPVPTRVTNMNDVRRTPATNSSNRNQIGNPSNRTIDQPIRTATPQRYNNQPDQQRILVQPNNRQDQQNRSIQREQVPATYPSNNGSPVRRPDAVRPQNNNQPIPQNNLNKEDNNSRQQNRISTPSNPTRSIQPMQPPKPVPTENNRPDRQQNNVNPQNNNAPPVQSRPVQRTDMNQGNRYIQPAQQPNVNRPENNQPVQRTATPANNVNRTNAGQPQDVNRKTDRPAKQEKSIRQEVKKEQDKTPDAVTDKK